MTEEHTKITVVDSIMGKGKTTWAADFMAENTEKRFVYCAPYLNMFEEMNDRLSERERRGLYLPSNRGSGKLDDFNEHLRKGDSIGVTHCTFSHANDETVKYLTENHYNLILDEELTVLMKYNDATGDVMKARDPGFLMEKELISVDDFGRVSWIGDSCADTKYSMIERIAKGGNLFLLNKKDFYWQFPPGLFDLFDEIYILTYLFEGSLMCPYFQYYGISYTKKSIALDEGGNRYLSDYTESIDDRLSFRRMIDILKNEKMNSYDGWELSKTWYIKNKDRRVEIRKHIEYYVRKIVKAKSKQVMWTTYEEYIPELRGDGYTRARNLTKEERGLPKAEVEKLKSATSCFVPCNAKGTNAFGDRDVLIYAMNYNMDPSVLQFFIKMNRADGPDINVFNDLISLNAMIQWIWRSAIRNGRPIKIYIPSTRMRTLFQHWLNGTLPE